MKRYRVEGFMGRYVWCERGEFRAPKAGEYYLSGAVPMVYRAPNTLTTSFRIMQPIREAKAKTVWY